MIKPLHHNCINIYITYIIPFSLKHIEHQSYTILNGRHQLPHTVLVGWVLFGPAGGGEGTIQLGDEPATGSCWWDKALILVVEVWRKTLAWHKSNNHMWVVKLQKQKYYGLLNYKLILKKIIIKWKQRNTGIIGNYGMAITGTKFQLI